MIPRRRPFKGPGLILALGCLVPAVWAGEGSIVRIGPCVNPDCNVTPPNSGFKGVATGNYHTMGLRSNGSVAAWGMCDVGQCTLPIPNTGFVAISAGDSHSLALRPDGSIAAWGSNENGELLVPAPNSGYKAIAAGLLHNLALKADGSIVTWGNTPWNDPVPEPNRDWVVIAAGGYYSMDLKSDGSVRRWGCNGPCPVLSPNTGFVAIATHFTHSLAVKTDGSVVAWGSNDFGQLDVPAPNAGFVAVAAGDSFIPQPNRGYLAMTANRGLGDAVRAPAPDGTFSDAPPISTSGLQTPTAIAADVDGDGDQDIVAAEYGANLVALYENNGTEPPIWTKRIIDASAFGPITVAVADLDGDGDLDAVGGNRFDPGSHIGVEWYENDGTVPPAFTVRRVSAGFVDAASVHAADLDGDGDGDILAVDVFRDTISLYENDGARPPVWKERVLTNATNDPWSVFAADLDGDGDLDVLSASAEDDTIAWYENGGGTPTIWTTSSAAISPSCRWGPDHAKRASPTEPARRR